MGRDHCRLLLSLLLIHFSEPTSLTITPPDVTIVNETDSVTLICEARGLPEPSIIWTKLGEMDFTPISPSDRTLMITSESYQRSGAVTVISTLEIYNASTSHAGVYQCSTANDPYRNRTLATDDAKFTLIVQSKIYFLLAL